VQAGRRQLQRREQCIHRVDLPPADERHGAAEALRQVIQQHLDLIIGEGLRRRVGELHQRTIDVQE
jgi:hypothetical protein